MNNLESWYTDKNSNLIHTSSIIPSDLQIGKGNTIGPFCTIYPGVIIGDNNYFESYMAVGAPAEKHGYFLKDAGQGLRIGDSNIIKEFTTLHMGTRRPTTIGSNCTICRSSHISHDTIIEDKVTVTCSLIGGESYIMQGANLGLGCMLHQFSVVGSWAMVGMGSICTKKLEIIPGNIYVGNPARYLKLNTVGLTRNKVDVSLLETEKLRWLQVKKDNPG